MDCHSTMLTEPDLINDMIPLRGSGHNSRRPTDVQLSLWIKASAKCPKCKCKCNCLLERQQSGWSRPAPENTQHPLKLDKNELKQDKSWRLSQHTTMQMTSSKQHLWPFWLHHSSHLLVPHSHTVPYLSNRRWLTFWQIASQHLFTNLGLDDRSGVCTLHTTGGLGHSNRWTVIYLYECEKCSH